jgi:dihydropteroate synthase
MVRFRSMAHVSVIGILNVTPDSYFDGGHYSDVSQALKRAGDMLREGADIIEIGGESTGPGSTDITAEEERQRILPVLIAIRDEYPRALLSVDTNKSAVASASIEKGAIMINDITALRGDSKMATTLAHSSCMVALMYSKDDTPRTTTKEVQYDNVMTTIKTFLKERKNCAIQAGITEDRIILDPGMGHFVSADPRYSFEILKHLSELKDLGCPILLSPSRKSFLAGEENLPPSERLPGTIAASALAVSCGASYIRTHDVSAIRHACEIAEKVAAIK